MTAVGFEPTANRLKGDCSTPELRGQITHATTEQHEPEPSLSQFVKRDFGVQRQETCVPSVSSVSGVSGVSGVSDKFESMWLTVSRVSRVSGVSGVSDKFESMWLTVSEFQVFQVFQQGL